MSPPQTSIEKSPAEQAAERAQVLTIALRAAGQLGSDERVSDVT